MSGWLKNADAFWSQDLGLTPDAFVRASGACCTAQSLYSGVQLFRRNGLLVLAAPEGLIGALEVATEGLTPDQLFSSSWLEGFCGEKVERILGPAEVHYADSSTFGLPDVQASRKLSLEDSSAYAGLAAALDPHEAESSGLDPDHFPAFGAFAGGVLAAVASYSIWEPAIAHIVVATHPGSRRRGFASSAVGALAQEAFGRGLILQWRALSANTNSLAMAERLGFVHYCSTLYARLKS